MPFVKELLFPPFPNPEFWRIDKNGCDLDLYWIR